MICIGLSTMGSSSASLFKDGKLVGADNRPVQKIEPETLSMAYQFHKDGEANPISAYAQASAKQTMGYRSGDFSEAERRQILSYKGVQAIKINDNILRSETAVISALSITNYLIN